MARDDTPGAPSLEGDVINAPVAPTKRPDAGTKSGPGLLTRDEASAAESPALSLCAQMLCCD